ncbi:MAG TPA: cupredoxin family protein [Burkholderiaceae bacterium]|nr:cupredoxin family protein [Burkholderiaceae bacterium]
MQQMLTPLLLAALLAAAAPAHAHGDAHPAQAAAAVKKEQKPWGIAGEARAATRTIEVRMGDDMRFKPDGIDVREGETVRIVVRNTGRVMHEFVLGTTEELEAHAALMAKFPNMEHDEPYMAHVAPGRRGEIVWTFNRAGEFQFACLIAGHYQAGMVGRLRVAASAARNASAQP